MNQADWMETAPGVWKTTIGNPIGLTPLTWMNRVPKLEAMQRMKSGLPLKWEDIRLEKGDRTVLSFPLEHAEAVYGMGLQFMKMDQRGRTRYLRVNSDPKQDTGETHAPVPFFVSDRGYGVLIDSASIVTIYCGSAVRLEDAGRGAARDRNIDREWKATPVSSRIEIRIPNDGVHAYLIAGPTLADAVRRYNLFCGGGALPPKWGLGFWHRVPTLFDQQEVLEEALAFRRRNFPCDVIGLEPGWHSRSYPVTNEWDQERYPKPASMLQTLSAQGFRVNLWEQPYLSPDSELYEGLKPLSGSHTVWGGLAPDYTLPQAQEMYKRQHKKRHVDIGVSGYKLDECDGSELTRHSWMFPAHAHFPSGHDGEQIRQLYGLLFQKMTDDMFREQNLRTYGLVRASGTGASSMPYVLYSDLYDHRQFVRALCNASFSGLLWTPEVRKADNAEDWVRRMQTVCFSPMALLNGWGDGTKPWSFPEVEHIIRHYLRLRMRLLPYLYTAFAQYHFEGIPPFRAMPFEGNSGEREKSVFDDHHRVTDTTDGAYGRRGGREWDDQYMVGDALLVAPLFAGESEREVLLPPGIWYGLETGERYDGGGTIAVRAELERIPVFVREGSVIPMMPATAHVPKYGEKVPLQMVHFGNSDGAGLLYDDDGETFEYEHDQKYQWWKTLVRKTSEGEFHGELVGSEKSMVSYSKVEWCLGQSKLPN
ncbi:ABC transporter substrate-binding protein [Paenibacillus agaridevorans]|uniref:ABC transporter substrate-binding protein n=1 Tax=Paenibacillus agaridevorans TaxID=171404 RepID=A0A2R5EQE9_9BACL|nr:glycoside hydrolase family 31 protein [Paenibacillus agaridevorans]GBG08936.1 ABC transporter substrate-binding protein [Paenibacillus agaridevorans]